MKKEYRVVNDKGNMVAQFPTELEANQYIEKKPNEKYSVKEAKVWSSTDLLWFVLACAILVIIKKIAGN